MTTALPLDAAGKPVEIWFTDEARGGQQGTLSRVWAKRSSRPRALRNRHFQWAFLFCVICPERSTGAAIFPEVNVAAMNEHLAEISRRVCVGAIAPAGAGWSMLAQLAAARGAREHHAVAVAALLTRIEPDGKCLGVPAQQLSQSPCLGRLRSSTVEPCCDAWNKLMQITESIASLTKRPKAVTG
jgi:hypothetical protein